MATRSRSRSRRGLPAPQRWDSCDNDVAVASAAREAWTAAAWEPWGGWQEPAGTAAASWPWGGWHGATASGAPSGQTWRRARVRAGRADRPARGKHKMKKTKLYNFWQACRAAGWCDDIPFGVFKQHLRRIIGSQTRTPPKNIQALNFPVNFPITFWMLLVFFGFP